MLPLRKILCAEDDADIRMILELSLTGVGGYEVRMCASGAEALASVVTFGPDMVLLDVMMPGMTGPETLAQLRLLDCMKGVPVVFLTAKALQSELEELLEAGATGIIVKPFDPMTLPNDLRLYWGHGRAAAV